MKSLLLKKTKKPYRPRATDILEDFLQNLTREKVTLADILTVLGHRAFGLAIFIMALANILISHIPGLSTILGAPIILISLQMIFGAQRPWLPKFLAQKQFDRTSIEKMIHRSVKALRKIEVFIKPRLLFLVIENDRILGVICLLLGSILVLPILFGNWLPAWSLAFIALGMIERDGLVILIGFIMGIGAFAYAVLFFTGFAHMLHWVFG